MWLSCLRQDLESPILVKNLIFPDYAHAHSTVDPRISGPRLYGARIIRTAKWFPINAHLCTRIPCMCGQSENNTDCTVKGHNVAVLDGGKSQSKLANDYGLG